MRNNKPFLKKIAKLVDEHYLRIYLREVDRRSFLKALGLGGAGLTLVACEPKLPEGLAPPPTSTPEPTPFVPEHLRAVSEEHLNLYRSEFLFSQGDSQGYSFHCVNCKGNCSWEIYEKDGRIVREEQAAIYPQISPGIPDANPRGCNKGAQHSAALYQGNRLLYPLKRAGARGAGKWQRISWAEAINEIATKMVDTLVSAGPEKLMIHLGTGVLSEAKRAGPLRLGSLLGAVRLFPSSAVGDMFTGVTLAYGVSVVGHTSEAWYEADYVLLLAINPSVARIPDAHYLWEGKYRGARVVTVSPDFNPTARQSSLWLPIKPGTDSFLMMSMINVVIREELYDEAFIREQTDLPFLVKKENGKLLRQEDIVAAGSDQIFYFYDEVSGRPVEAPGSMGSSQPTLRLDGIRPALAGVFRVKNARGEEIEVTTVFELIKKEVEKFPPEETQRFTGIHSSLVYEEARRIAEAETAIIAIGYQLHKHFWGILACWGAALLAALTGHAARRGGLDADNEWGVTGMGPLSTPKPPRFGSGFFGEWLAGNMQESFASHYDDDELKARLGLDQAELLEVAEESQQKGWMPSFGQPKVMMLFFDNRFVRNSAQKESTRAILQDTELYVNVNFRLDSSAQLADIVLPATTSYESFDLRANPGYSRFANLTVPPQGLQPLGEIKSEWEICMLLTKRVQEIAQERGVSTLDDPDFETTRNLDTLYDEFVTVDGQTISNDQQVVEWILNTSPPFRGWSLKMAQRTGFVPVNETGGQLNPLYPDRPYYSFEKQVYLKRPYQTLSGRQQFYIDHDLYLRLGCATPTAREPLNPGRYPFAYYTPHTRWGIHSTWRDAKHLLRLQRGVPYIHLNPGVAREKGIQDGDTLRVFNDVGEMTAMAKLHPGTPPDVIWTEHAWENFQFADRQGYNSVVAGLINPLELVGEYGHLTFSPSWDGNQLSSEAAVDIEKVA